MENVNGWRKSSYSGNGGGNCVEIGQDADGTILVRDTKQHGSGPVHRCAQAEWQAFIARVRSGGFGLDESGRLPLGRRTQGRAYGGIPVPGVPLGHARVSG